jgi:hypothetical protein
MSGPAQSSMPMQDAIVYGGGVIGTTAGATSPQWLPLINSVLGLILLVLSIMAMGMTVVYRWKQMRHNK